MVVVEKSSPLTLNTAALLRRIVVVPAGDRVNSQLAASLQAELMQLGFMLDELAFAAVSAAPQQLVAEYSQEIIPYLGKQLGADRGYQSFYRNFPQQVMEMSDVALFINAIVHYWSNGTWEPAQQLEDRGYRFEQPDFKLLRRGSEEDLKNAFTRLVSSNQSLTATDRTFIEWAVNRYGLRLILPKAIPFRETLCLLAANGVDVPVQTTTDVLRIAVYLSGGDISLPGVPKLTPSISWPPSMNWYATQQQNAEKAARAKFKFKKFGRADRRRILAWLENTNLDVTEMQRHLGRWKRLGEILHVGEYAERFPKAASAFQRLRNQPKGKKIRTFAANVNLSLAAHPRKGIELLASRPGELARRLDYLVRTFEPELVLPTFERLGMDVSAKVLFELYNHFTSRNRENAPRSVMLKGRGAKMKALPPLPAMPMELVDRITSIIVGLMRRRIASLPPIGKVWVDEALREVPLPFAMRSVNTAIKTYIRGTRLPFRQGARVLRPFIHWFDADGREDLDLSVGLYDGTLKNIGHVSFTGLKDMGCCHSGDIRHRKGPCAEYVDIPVATAAEHGVRYATVHVYNYNGRPLHSVKDCVFGLMERESAQANEIFVPKTISNCMKLANESTSVVVCIIDLERSQFIWADIESNRSLPTLENAANQTAQVLEALIHGTKMSVYDLLQMHVDERGTMVDNNAEADLALHWKDLVTDYATIGSFMMF